MFITTISNNTSSTGCRTSKGLMVRGENHLKHIVLRSLQYFLNIIQKKIHGIKRKRKNNAIKKMEVSREGRKETDMKK
jgi:hypothetical protein